MIYLGTVNWRYPHWVNSFYPNEDESQWLSYYAKQSGFVEISSTYTRILPPEIINHLVSNTSNDFIFASSMAKQVTFDNKNKIQHSLLLNYFNMLEPLGNRLGVVLLHFPKHLQYNAQNMEFVTGIIDACQEHFNGYFVIDINNRSWFIDEVNKILLKKSACMMNSDRKPIGSSMSNPEIYYLKLSGDSRLIPAKEFGKTYFSREADIEHWTNHLKFKAKRHKNIFVSIDNHFSGDSTKDAYTLSKALSANKIQFYGFKKQ